MEKITKFKEVNLKQAWPLLGIWHRYAAWWMNPYWAGLVVAVIASTTGASIRKGALRVVGTIPGCLAALVIHALTPQERWTFMLLTMRWMFFTSYMMVSRQKNSYFWLWPAMCALSSSCQI